MGQKNKHMKARSREDIDEMQNDCSLIQMIDYKQMPLHKDPLLLRTTANKGIHCITKKFLKTKRTLRYTTFLGEIAFIFECGAILYGIPWVFDMLITIGFGIMPLGKWWSE